MSGHRQTDDPITSILVLLSALALLAQCDHPSVGAALEGRAEAAAFQNDDRIAQAADPVCPTVAPSPDALPGVRPEHLQLDYWLDRVAQEQGDLDEVLLTSDEIQNHNSALMVHQDDRPLGLYDLLGPVDTAILQTSIDERLVWMREQFETAHYVESDGSPLSVAALASFDSVTFPATIDAELRVALDLVPVRCGPRLESFFTPSLDLRFDRNNCSSAHTQEIIQVLAGWPNGLRLVRTRYTIGWIAPDAPLSAPVEGDEAERLVSGATMRLATEQELTSDDGESAMILAGTLLVPAGRGGQAYFATATGIHRSQRLSEDAFVLTDRPFTRRAVLEEAFTYLGSPYGWGGQGGGQDCSRFLLDIFEAFGFELPRHSAYQAAAGVFSIDVSGLENETERMLLIDAAARRGIVLLHFPGHIMLYLGRDSDGVPMVMHAFAEYLVPCPEGSTPEFEAPETLFTVDSVSVSDLELGRGTSRTAFIERITKIVVLGRTPGLELAGVAELRPAAPVEIPEWRECRDSQEVAIFQMPLSPDTNGTLRVVATSERQLGPVELLLVGPEGIQLRPEVVELGGPPFSVMATVETPRYGGWRAVWGDGSRVEACWRFRVRDNPAPTRTAPDFLEERAEREALEAEAPTPEAADESGLVPAANFDSAADSDVAALEGGEDGVVSPPSMGPVWDLSRRWGPATENLYAAWIESLFSYSPEEDLTWTSLHELLVDRDRNFLHGYLGQNEDELLAIEEDGDEGDLVLFLQPDCADLPYLLRAYFSWKLRLPYGFRRCARGRAGQPPGCMAVNSNRMDRVAENDVEAFAYFANREVRRAVHSASGRTHPDYEFSDYYPVELTRETLIPGTTFADPYGHLLVIVDWVPQTMDSYGMLIGADAQPDGTVGRRRFWRGSFLFSPDTTDVGAGFKAFRPLYVAAEGEQAGQLIALTNELLAETRRYRRISSQQYDGTAEDFYRTMEALINPRPLDPVAMQVALVDALEEGVSRRLTSVSNGEGYMLETRYRTVEMPEHYAIFETIGAWEDFSTPSRDMRLLISIDTVVNFRQRVGDEPERYGLRPGVDLDTGLASLSERLDQELASRTFTYQRSDGSTWELNLRDVADRQVALEMAYNPNDCVEIRWGAPEGSDEYSTCQRHAPVEQRERMLSYRSWFVDRARPPR